MIKFKYINAMADILGLSKQTIRRLFDRGALEGSRSPGSRYRKVSDEELARFIKEHELPVIWFGSGRIRIYTIGQVAKILKRSEHAITNAFNQGKLKGFKLPNSTHRRIPRANLVKYMKMQGMPIKWLQDFEKK